MAVTVRPLAPIDEADWRRLWRAYLAFYETDVSEEIYSTYFERLLGTDPRDYSALVAERDGRLVGLAHYVFHRHGWKLEDTCYLQDLYADPSVRGMGIGRKLIAAVYAAADTAGAPSVYWMTQEDNQTARQLYDRVGQATNFIKYLRPA